MSRQPDSENDLLLHVLTARETMTWGKFKEVFEVLYLRLVRSGAAGVNDIRFKRSQTRRALDALGHCDFSFSSGHGRVQVAPPVLVRLPCAGLPKAILAGARSPKSIARLRLAANDRGAPVTVIVEPQERNLVLAPARVSVQTETIGDLEALASALGINFTAGPPAWALLHASGSLDSERASWKWQPETALTWRRRDFDPHALRFVVERGQEGPARLASFTDPKRQTLRHYFYAAGRQALVDRDWGCYAVLHESNLNVLAYDHHQFVMAVPTGAPLPSLLARALALCSGLAPSFIPAERALWESPEHRGFDVYHAIPPLFATEVERRLGQVLLQQHIDL